MPKTLSSNSSATPTRIPLRTLRIGISSRPSSAYSIRMSPEKNIWWTAPINSSTVRRQAKRPEKPAPLRVAFASWIAKLRPNRKAKIEKNLPLANAATSCETSGSKS